jgi:hypothetical protein
VEGKDMRTPPCQRPSGITVLAFFEFCGVLGCLALLFFTPVGSRDFMAFLVGAVLGLLVVGGLWTMQPWAYWATAIYEAMEILYELFLITLPAYHNLTVAGPLFGIVMSAVTLGYLFLDRRVRLIFRNPYQQP